MSAPNYAPYKIFKVGQKYVVKNNAGETKATFDDNAKALAYLRALYVNVPGAPKNADKKKWTGEQKRAVKAAQLGPLVPFDPQRYLIPRHGFFLLSAAGEDCVGCGLALDSPLHEFAEDDLGVKKKGHKFRRQTENTYKGAGWYPACVVCGRPASDPDHDGDTDAPGAVDNDTPGTPQSSELAALPKQQKCKFGDEPATKRVVWAEGMAYIPVCDSHMAKAKSVIEGDNKDEITEILDVENSCWAPPFVSMGELGFVQQAYIDTVLLSKLVAHTELRVEPPAEPITPDTQRAFVSELNGKTLITGTAEVMREMSASPRNKHMLGINGKFVGGEKANRNGALWTTADLEMGVPSVTNGPLNWLHESRHVIGSISKSALITRDEPIDQDLPEPYIAAASVLWRWLYPDEAAVVEMASDVGKLYYSMECIAENVHCGGCGEQASYGDYMQGKAGCAHMRQRSETRRFENPTFLGGAVIVPPVNPGWADAYANVLPQAAAMAEKAYDQAGKPDVPASEWEALMASVVAFAGVPER